MGDPHPYAFTRLDKSSSGTCCLKSGTTLRRPRNCGRKDLNVALNSIVGFSHRLNSDGSSPPPHVPDVRMGTGHQQKVGGKTQNTMEDGSASSAYFQEVVETLMAMTILGPGCAGMERERDRLPVLQERAWTSSQNTPP